MKVSSVYIFLFVLLFALAGCGPEEPEVVALPTRTPRPTFTPTPLPAAPQPVAAVETATFTPEPANAAPVAEAPAAEAPVAEPTATDTPAPQQAKALITNAQANVRTGPGTNYALAGTLERGAEFEIVGKNPAGDWWQLCCLNGQNVWIAGFLVDTSGPVDGVAVAADIPAPPPVVVAPAPAAPTAVPASAEPTPAPAPAFTVQKGEFVEPRPNSSPLITFYGTLCKQRCPDGGGVGGYKLIVEGPQGRSEVVFEDIASFRHGDPGQPSEFIYNAKLEIPGGPAGNYRAFVADMGGNPVSDAWEYAASGNLRIFLPRWIVP